MTKLSVPEILKGNPHLPIKENTTTHEAITLVNQFYSTNLLKRDFVNNVAYRDQEKRLCIDLVHKEELMETITLMDHNTLNNKPRLTVELTNPLIREGLKLIAPPLQVLLEEELAFFDKPRGYSFKQEFLERDLETLERLRDLLNNYQYLGKWYVGDLHDYSLLNSKVIYNGDASNIPKGLNLGEPNRVIVLELVSGVVKGNLCITHF